MRKQDKEEPVISWKVCHYQNEQLHELSLKYRDDKNYRDKVKSNSGELLKSLGVALPEGIDARFVVNTDKMWYFVMPQRPKWSARARRPGGGAAALNLINVASLAVSLASFRRRAR